jgi:hypothetical protein
MNSRFQRNMPAPTEKENQHPSTWFRINSSQQLHDRWLTTDSSEKKMIPERGLARSNGQRVFTIEPKDKRRRWKIFRKTKSRLFQKDKDKNKNKIKNNAKEPSLKDETEEEESSSVSLAELEYFDELDDDNAVSWAELEYFDELDDDHVVLNEHSSSLRHLITETLSHPDTNKRLSLLAADDLIRVKIHKDYTDVLLDHSSLDQCDFDIPIHLLAANHLVQEFLAEQVQDLIRSTFMSDTIREVIFHVVEDYIQPRIAHLYSNIDDVTPADAAKIVSWIDNFLNVMKSQCPLLEPMPLWRVDCERLVEHYLDRGVRREMKELVQRSMDFSRSEKDIREQSNGIFVTGFSDQIGFLCELQLSVAKDILPQRCMERVLAACNEELLVMICDLMFQVEANWKEMSPRRFCAIINDASLLSEQCDDRNDLFLSSPEYTEAGNELTRELTEVSLHATRYLCERIMLYLQDPEPILTSVGDADWESDGTGSAVERTITTLNDLFSDFEVWLISDYFFPKVLKHCLDLTLQIYIESFFSNTMLRGVRDPRTASFELKQDHIRLVIFFNGDCFAKFIGKAGFYQQHEIDSRLHILESLSILLNPDLPPSEICQEIKIILVEICGGAEHGEPAVLHLAGLRKHHSANEAIEWIKAISQANKSILKEDVQARPLASSTPCYKVPDLRNSKYIRNVRPIKRQLLREFSVASRPAAESTYALVHTRAPTSTDLLFTANLRMITNALTRR